MMHELSLSPIYRVLLEGYLVKVGAGIEERKAGAATTGDVNDIEAHSMRLSQGQAESLMARIFECTGSKSFGMEIGNSVHPSDFGTVGYFLMNCSSLFQVFDCAAKYKHSLNQGFNVSMTKKAGLHHFQIDNLVKSSWFDVIVEMDFASCLCLSRFFVGADKAKKVKPVYVSFSHSATAPLDHYEAIFSCPVRFNQPINEVVFTREIFEIPIRSANPKLFRLMKRKLAQRLEKLASSQRLSCKTNLYLRSNVDQGFPAIDVVAKDFGLAVSTFQKHLRNEGTHYTQLVEDARHQLALLHLSQSDKSVAALAAELGFSSQNAFIRAFKRWEGVTPSAFRNSP
jgi:AraC-like DNA-binding protein